MEHTVLLANNHFNAVKDAVVLFTDSTLNFGKLKLGPCVANLHVWCYRRQSHKLAADTVTGTGQLGQYNKTLLYHGKPCYQGC